MRRAPFGQLVVYVLLLQQAMDNLPHSLVCCFATTSIAHKQRARSHGGGVALVELRLMRAPPLLESSISLVQCSFNAVSENENAMQV